MGYYLKWDPQECYYYAAKNTGFRPNTERTEGSYSKYSSIDDKIDDFFYYTMGIKFGIGRATTDASQEIRSGDIERSEGVLLVNKFDHEFPERFFQVGISEANMMSMAAGMTIGGKIPFTGTFANFSTSRVYDQIRQSIAYSSINYYSNYSNIW